VDCEEPLYDKALAAGGSGQKNVFILVEESHPANTKKAARRCARPFGICLCDKAMKGPKGRLQAFLVPASAFTRPVSRLTLRDAVFL
jgi:hypothetical protein